MSDCHAPQQSEEDAAIEREIREGRSSRWKRRSRRLAGPGAIKGESPVARKQQAEIEIGTWLRGHIGRRGGRAGSRAASTRERKRDSAEEF